jgi:hypothetical protein
MVSEHMGIPRRYCSFVSVFFFLFLAELDCGIHLLDIE